MEYLSILWYKNRKQIRQVPNSRECQNIKVNKGLMRVIYAIIIFDPLSTHLWNFEIVVSPFEVQTKVKEVQMGTNDSLSNGINEIKKS